MKFVKFLIAIAISAATLWANPALAWSPDSSLIRFGSTNYCLDTDGSRVFLSECRSRTLSQRWGWTASNELRTPAFQNKCLGTDKRLQRNGTALRLFACRGFQTQQWDFVKKVIRVSGGMCLDVPGGRAALNAGLIIWRCDTSNSNQQWTTSSQLREYIGADRANDMGFPKYRRCAADQTKPYDKNSGLTHKKCHLKPTVMGVLDQLSPTDLINPKRNWLFGYYSGQGHGKKWNEPTLDFGDHLSVDYCSKIHDYGYSKDATTSGKLYADMGYYRCLGKVRPVTSEEAAARTQAQHVFLAFVLQRASETRININSKRTLDEVGRRWNLQEKFIAGKPR